MLLTPLTLLRFKARPTDQPDPPPKGKIDMFYSPSAGKFVARDSDGNAVKFDSDANVDTSTGGNGTGDAGKLAAFRSSGELAASSVIFVFSSNGQRQALLTQTNSTFSISHGDLGSGKYDSLVFPDTPDERTWTLPEEGGSLLVAETSSGGNGTADENKIPLFGSLGNLNATAGVSARENSTTNFVGVAAGTTGAGVLSVYASRGANTFEIQFPALFGASRTAVLPDSSGTISLIALAEILQNKTLAAPKLSSLQNAADDVAAAAAGVPVGGIYHDLGNLRVRLS